MRRRRRARSAAVGETGGGFRRRLPRARPPRLGEAGERCPQRLCSRRSLQKFPAPGLVNESSRPPGPSPGAASPESLPSGSSRVREPAGLSSSSSSAPLTVKPAGVQPRWFSEPEALRLHPARAGTACPIFLLGCACGVCPVRGGSCRSVGPNCASTPRTLFDVAFPPQ